MKKVHAVGVDELASHTYVNSPVRGVGMLSGGPLASERCW